MSKLSSAAAHYRVANENFARRYSIPRSASVFMGSDNTSVVDKNGKGINGNALLLGSVTEVSMGFLWKWGWKYVDFDAPVIDRSKMMKAFGSDAKKFGVDRGSAVMRSIEIEEMIRGVCMREYNLVYITEFSSPSESFVIGFLNAEEYTLDADAVAMLPDLIEVTGNCETDPEKLKKLNLKLQRLTEE